MGQEEEGEWNAKKMREGEGEKGEEEEKRGWRQKFVPGGRRRGEGKSKTDS